MIGRSIRCVASLMLVGLLLGGCSSMKSFVEGKDASSPDATQTAAESDAQAAAKANADHASYRLEVDAPRDLRRLLLNFLDLSRFQDVPAADGLTGSELERLIGLAPAQARSLLETEGYFNAEITVTKIDEEAGKPPLLRIKAVPGPRTLVKSVSIDAEGPLKTAEQAGDKPAGDTLRVLRTQWPLPIGQPFLQSGWASAKSATLARLRGSGYALASWAETGAQVDALSNSAALRAVAQSGPLYRLGPIRIEGLQRYDQKSVLNLATFSPGSPYSEKLVLDYQDRLQKLGLFESSSVEIQPDPTNADAVPVIVRVKEQPLQQATFGVGYSTNTGPRVTVEHLHRSIFGSGWIAKNKVEVGPQRKALQSDFTSPPLDNLYRNIVSGGYENLRSAEELRKSWNARVGRLRDTPRIERLYFAEVTHVQLDNSAGSSSNEAVSANYHWLLRDVDSVLLPTRGITLSTQSAAGYAFSNVDSNGPFVREWARLTWYRPFGNSWFGTARLEAGQVFANSRVGVPDTILFRAGGDDSVRGYGYRTLGPLVDGAISSGRVVMTSSVEVAHPIFENQPALLWAAFIDAGNAADTWGRLHPAVGYGAGIRLRSPVGPVRVDIAYGERVRQFRLHLNVGVTF